MKTFNVSSGCCLPFPVECANVNDARGSFQQFRANKIFNSMLLPTALPLLLLTPIHASFFGRLPSRKNKETTEASKEDDIEGPGEGDKLLSAKAEEIPMKEFTMADKLPGPTVAVIDSLRYGDGCELKVVTQSDDPRRPWKHHIAFERAPGGKLKPVFVTCEKRSAEMIRPEGKDFAELLEGFAPPKTDSCLLMFDQLFNRALDINKGLRDAIGSDGGETLKRFSQTRPFLGMGAFPKAYKPVYADEWRSYHFGKMLCDYIYHDAPLKDEGG